MEPTEVELLRTARIDDEFEAAKAALVRDQWIEEEADSAAEVSTKAIESDEGQVT